MIRIKGDDGNYIYKKYGEPFRMIFNAAANREYAFEAIEKLGGFDKLKSDDYEILGIPGPLSKEDREIETILSDLKGVGNQDVGEYVKELGCLVERIMDIAANFGPDGMLEDDFINEVIPESRGKSGNDLEPYRIKFNDAMYMFYKGTECGKYKRTLKRLHAEWKKNHGYLEGK
jgi:hypothetical protein